ncbi:3-methyl-2-oxobutanoate hydroxymethyltransferase [Thauera sp.]|uniref:3-methyl-2-oxobutanoate hydroxymethyltransferase n=1 Tax=Thauera sp. TaxID=1905334 RepID=UPI0039E55F07
MTGYLQANDSTRRTKAVTLQSLFDLRSAGKKISVLTAYDSSFAALMDRCSVDVLLVGDSLGNVVQGQSTTLPVTLEHMAYHTACVAHGNERAFLVADLPFGTYATPQAAYDNAVKLMQAGAQMVKLEGGAWLADTVRFLCERGVPVFAHIGLTPQYVHRLGGFRVQGRTQDDAERIKADALALQDAGASMMLLEAIPAGLGHEVTELLSIPTIGIGAGPDCSGQVLVMHDMLGVFPGRKARFVCNFMEGQSNIEGAVRAYVRAVREGSFPGPEHCF